MVVALKVVVKAVELGQPINQAACDHGVLITTLKDRVSGRLVHGVQPGRKPYLCSAEEELGDFLKRCVEVGHGKARRHHVDS